jgi:hypothetical protein
MWRILTFCKYKVKEYKQFVNVENINNLEMWRISIICRCEEY